MNLNSTIDHYTEILELKHPWRVTHTEIQRDTNQILIHLEYEKGHQAACPVCNLSCPLQSHREERRWRHLDVMQYKSFLVCKVPRTKCSLHGVKTIATPFADNLVRYTTLFTNHVLDVLESVSSIKSARTQLKMSWNQISYIMHKAVERGLHRRVIETIRHLGIDEKSYLKPRKYITNLVDLDQSQVLEVAEGRTKESTKQALSVLTPEQQLTVTATCMDMWEAYKTATEEVCLNSEIVYDRFHVMKYLTGSVNEVRMTEHKELLKNHFRHLTHTKFLWLKNTKNWNEADKHRFNSLKDLNLKVSKAWYIKELFQEFWVQPTVQDAQAFFKRWYFVAVHSKLPQVIKVAKMLKTHLKGLLSYIVFHISNGVTEGLNTIIQNIKANARGFRNFQNYRMRILFRLGKLDLRV